MKQIGMCPVTRIELVDVAMECCETPLEENAHTMGMDASFIIVEPDNSKNEAAEGMCCGVHRHFLKKHTILSKRCADAAIKNIALKCTKSTLCHFNEPIIPGQMVGT
jgi:hypothetical protein